MAKSQPAMAPDLPAATVYSLAEWRERRGLVKIAATAFQPSERPGMDFNDIEHWLAAAAKYLRQGKMSLSQVGGLLERLEANAQIACRRGHDLEFCLRQAERVLGHQFGCEGKVLAKAIKQASDKLSMDERAERRKERTKARKGR